MFRAILTDIEGTTTSISFVYDVLFPYAREHLGDFVRSHAEDAHVVQYINDVRLEAGENLDLEGVIAQLQKWMDEDKKVTPLKGLQGLVWENGYRNGDFKGHVYADAYDNLRNWHEQGIVLAVYSSGSVKAQQLLFSHTDYGDMTPLFSAYFDTKIGAKVDAASYRRIADALGIPPTEILFLSDVDKELDAAAAAGMQTCWLVRDKRIDTNAEFRQAADFSQVTPQ